MLARYKYTESVWRNARSMVDIHPPVSALVLASANLTAVLCASVHGGTVTKMKKNEKVPLESFVYAYRSSYQDWTRESETNTLKCWRCPSSAQSRKTLPQALNVNFLSWFILYCTTSIIEVQQSAVNSVHTRVSRGYKLVEGGNHDRRL